MSFENKMADQLDQNLFANEIIGMKRVVGDEMNPAGMDEMDDIVAKSEMSDNHYISISDVRVEPEAIVHCNFISFSAAMKLFSAQCTAENLDTNPQGKLVSSKQRKVKNQLTDENFQYNEKSLKITPSFIYDLAELGKLEEGRYGAFKALQSVNCWLRGKQEITVLVQAAVEKNLSQGFWKKLAPDMGLDRLQSHVLPRNYIMSDSKSTPCRLVADPSQPDKNGWSLNGCQVRGTGYVGEVQPVLLQIRL